MPGKPLPTTGQSTGVDVCIATFATLSNGEAIDNLRPYEAAQRKLKRAQQRVARKRNCSSRWSQAARVRSAADAAQSSRRRWLYAFMRVPNVGSSWAAIRTLPSTLRNGRGTAVGGG